MIVLVVDCEAVNQYGKWSAIAMLVASYPNGQILGKFEIYTERKKEEFDESRVKWWGLHADAYAYIVKRAQQDKRSDSQKEIAMLRFIRRMHERYPRLQIVSDNPGFDIKIIDVLAEKHGFPTVSHRADGMYTQPKCAYTKTKTLETRQLRLPQMVVDMFGVPQFTRPIDGPLTDAPRHTPLNDAQKIMHQYFDAIDVEQCAKEGVTPHRFVQVLQAPPPPCLS